MPVVSVREEALKKSSAETKVIPAPEVAPELRLPPSVISAPAAVVRAKIVLPAAVVIAGRLMLLVALRVTLPNGVVPPKAPLRVMPPAAIETSAKVFIVETVLKVPPPALKM